jgi:hypothetical protein
MKRIAVAEPTSEAFAPFGKVGAPHTDGGQAPLARRQVERDIDCAGTSRDPIDGEPWLIAVVPASIAPPELAVIIEPVSDFYDLEMVDTNIANYTVWWPDPLVFAT